MTCMYEAGHSFVGHSAGIPILARETDFLTLFTYVLKQSMPYL